MSCLTYYFRRENGAWNLWLLRDPVIIYTLHHKKYICELVAEFSKNIDTSQV